MLDDAEGRGATHPGRGWVGGAEARGGASPRSSADSVAEQLYGVLARQLWSLLLPMLFIPLIASIALLRMPADYTATGTVIYDPAGYAPEVLQSILKTDPTTDAVVASQASVLGSLSIAQRMAARLGLARAPGFDSIAHLPAAERPLALDRMVMRDIAVTPIGDSRVFGVSFTAQNPMLAAAAANTIMDLYLSDQVALKSAALRAANRWMQSRAAALRLKLAGQDAAIARYRAENGLVAGVQARIGTEEVSTLSDDLMGAENELANAGARQQVATDTGLATAMSQNVVAMRLAAAQAQAELDAALARFGPNYPTVRALRDQLDALQGALGAETAAARAGVRTDAQAAAARLARLRTDLQALRQEGAREAEADVPLQAMEQDADANRVLLQALLSRMDQTAQQEAIETPDARILSRAEPPAVPASPRRRLLLAASVLVGVVTGCALAWAREGLATTFRTEGDVHAVLDLPCFGAIPQQASLSARPLQLLRGRLHLSGTDPRFLMITSTRPGEGKSAFAIALARAAARAGERVLLVDCDLWQCNLSRLLSADEAPGLSDLLADRADTAGLARIDSVPGLAFLPAGLAKDGQRLGDLPAKASVENWRRSYDLILLDAPPVLAGADALLLAEMADGILLCIRWNHTPRRLALHARMLLGRQTGRSLAVVLTRLGARSRAVRGFPEGEIGARRYAAYNGG